MRRRSAAALCLAALLTGCGSGGSDHGYVAVGAVGAEPGAATAKAVPPTGDVTLVPLDRAPGGRHASTPGSGRGASDDSRLPATPGRGDGGKPHSDAPGSGSGSPGRTGGGSSGPAPAPPDRDTGPEPDPDPAPPKQDRPAALTVGEPERAPTDRRWCEKVTLALHNTGDKPVLSGTVTFATHIIGALGIDWGTVESTQDLSVPIDGGEKTEQTWTVCVDAWRVPLGMHIETQDVDVDWK